MRVSLAIEIDDIAEATREWTHEELMEFILASDLAVADAGFTEALVMRLCLSLRGDLETHDWEALVTEISAMKPQVKK